MKNFQRTIFNSNNYSRGTDILEGIRQNSSRLIESDIVLKRDENITLQTNIDSKDKDKINKSSKDIASEQRNSQSVTPNSVNSNDLTMTQRLIKLNSTFNKFGMGSKNESENSLPLIQKKDHSTINIPDLNIVEGVSMEGGLNEMRNVGNVGNAGNSKRQVSNPAKLKNNLKNKYNFN